jgi:hypothetical protein
MELGRALPRTPRPASRADHCWDGDYDGLQQLRVVDVRGGELDGERDPVPIHDQMVFAAALPTEDPTPEVEA